MTGAPRVKKEIAEFSALIWERGWVANHDGNVSAKSGEGDRFLITPTATSKRLCAPETIVECNLSGIPVGRGKPPSEVAMHLGAYRARKDVAAVIHAHPPHASAFALARVELGCPAMPEVVVSLGESIPLVPLLLPKDPATADLIGAALELADAALLAGNGAITVGPDLETAFLRMELLEHYAKILAIARGNVGAPVALDAGQKERLLEMRKAAGLARAPKKAAATADSNVRRVVAEEVRRALGVEK
jgi:L-fuculose-phosphate aldolase